MLARGSAPVHCATEKERKKRKEKKRKEKSEREKGRISIDDDSTSYRGNRVEDRRDETKTRDGGALGVG